MTAKFSRSMTDEQLLAALNQATADEVRQAVIAGQTTEFRLSKLMGSEWLIAIASAEDNELAVQPSINHGQMSSRSFDGFDESISTRATGEFPRVDDRALLHEQKRTNELLTDILKQLKKK